MSEYLGFQPTERAFYYFLSYNSQDAERVGILAKELMQQDDIPLWYDYGIEYGEQWAPQINEKLEKSQAVLLFFTKGILDKEDSYVRLEYKMAKTRKKKIFVIMMDDINDDSVPTRVLDWWIQIKDEQNLNPKAETFRDNIKKALGIETQEARMNLLIKQYQELYDQGKAEEANQYFSEFLYGKSLKTKAQLIHRLLLGKIPGIEVDLIYRSGEKIEKSNWAKTRGLTNRRECSQLLVDEQNKWRKVHGEDLTYESRPDYSSYLEIDNTLFVATTTLFHRSGGRGDIGPFRLWRNVEVISVVGGLIEAYTPNMFYDKGEDSLYVFIGSEIEYPVPGEPGEFDSIGCTTAVIVKNPLGEYSITKIDDLYEAKESIIKATYQSEK